MQNWIDQAKNKLMSIIEQAKKDVVNLNLRVAFVGYGFRDDFLQLSFSYATALTPQRALDCCTANATALEYQ